jgi:uncharacterized repeat protein (TIGR02543 family)
MQVTSSSTTALPTAPAKTGYIFAGWNTRQDGTGTAFTAATPVTANITVYAQWQYPSGTQSVGLRFSDPGTGAFDQTTFTVIKGGSPASQSITLTGTWTSQEWRVDGKVRGNGTSFTVDAADYTVGGHVLELVVSNGGAPWSKTLRFTVVQPVTELRLNKYSLTLPVGGSETLYATILPANASNKIVAWSSSNSTVASVNASGLVSAIAPGTATITATSQDGNLTKFCAVTVATAQDISLRFSDPGAGAFDQTSFTVTKGGASQIITLTGTWTSQEWRVDGKVRGAETSFEVNAADYTEGGHLLELVVVKGGVPWSKTLRFRVASN